MIEKPARPLRTWFSAVFPVFCDESNPSNLYCNFLSSCANPKPSLSYLGMFLLLSEIIFDDEKGRQAPGHAFYHRLSSVLRRIEPLKALLVFFEFVCQLETEPSLFGRVFTSLRNNFRWLKSRPGPGARDFPPFSSVLQRIEPFKALLEFFEVVCQPETKSTSFRNVFTALRNNFPWLECPPGSGARDFTPFFQRFATSRTLAVKILPKKVEFILSGTWIPKIAVNVWTVRLGV